MERILDQFHNKETFLFCLSRMFERGVYYGLRSLLVMYMVGELIKMDTTEALKTYGWFIFLIFFFQIFGALIGDLIIGNKKAIIIGGIFQAFGAICFCIPTITGLYIGLLFLILGSGLYTPNLTSNFGKLYLSKKKLLDAAFTLLYFAVNIGSFFGVLLISYFGKEYGWNSGFILSAILILVSIIPIIILKEEENLVCTNSELPQTNNVLKILIAMVLVGLFWALYEISNIRILNLELKLYEVTTLNIPEYIWSTLSSAFVFPISLIACICWTYFYSTQYHKLTIGFICGAISFGLLFLIPEIPSEQHIFLYLGSLFMYSISEIHIGPIIHSILTEYTNPNYLAIVVSLAFIPTRVFLFLVGLLNKGVEENGSMGMLIGMIAMVGISFGLIGYLFLMRKLKYSSNFED